MQGFLDGVLIEAFPVLFFRRRRQVARTVFGIFTEDRRTGEAVPQGTGKILINQVLGQGGNGPVIFIDDERYGYPHGKSIAIPLRRAAG